MKVILLILYVQTALLEISSKEDWPCIYSSVHTTKFFGKQINIIYIIYILMYLNETHVNNVNDVNLFSKNFISVYRNIATAIVFLVIA